MYQLFALSAGRTCLTRRSVPVAVSTSTTCPLWQTAATVCPSGETTTARGSPGNSTPGPRSVPVRQSHSRSRPGLTVAAGE